MKRPVKFTVHGAAIRHRRRRNGLSQIALAKKVRTSPRMISEAERGRATERMVKRIAAALNWPEDEFYCPVSEEPPMTPQQAEVLEIMQGAPQIAGEIWAFAVGRRAAKFGQAGGVKHPSAENGRNRLERPDQ